MASGTFAWRSEGAGAGSGTLDGGPHSPDKVVELTSLDKADPLLDREQVLIRRAQQGDREAFAGLVEAYWERLYRWLYRLAHERHTAEDLAQEAFLKAFANIQRFRAGTNFQAWLFRIAYNRFVNQYRRAARTRQPMPEQLVDTQPGPVEEAVVRETRDMLARAVGRLPAEYRAALTLRIEEGMSFREIAAVLNITEETARWRVFKARKKLMEVLHQAES
jgi:RNA polymerase sigma-70 factor (ECF subfamily)